MSTQIKRLLQNDKEFVPITLAEAVVVNTANISGLSSLGITTLDKVLRNTLNIVGVNTSDIDTLEKTVSNINQLLNTKQDKLTAGTGITISDKGVISITNQTTGFSYKIVKTLPTAEESQQNIVYLVPSYTQATNNLFTEYICILKDDKYIWEQLGTVQTDVDLSGYVTKTEFNTAMASALTAQNITNSVGNIVAVTYNIPSNLYG